MDSIKKGLSNPIIIPLKTKKFNSDDFKQRSQGVKPFKCENCDAGFMKNINLKRHIKVIHEEVKPYNCGTCDANFTSKGNMKKHIATIHEGQRQNLNGIDSKFEEVSNEGKLSSDSYTDMSKPKMSYVKLISEALLNSYNGMLIRSDIYKSISARHPYYQMNVSGWQNSVSVTLTLNKSFVKSKSANKRSSSWKLSENLPKSIKKLDKHVSRFHGEKALNKLKSQRQIASVHDRKKLENDFKCTICNKKSYTEEHTLEKHIENVHKVKQQIFKCFICDGEFGQKAELRVHIDSVHDGKKFKCSSCEYVTAFNQNLTKHIEAVHEGIRYNCTICDDVSYTQKQQLNKHIKSVHEGKKLFRCLICDGEFTESVELKNHIESVHPELDSANFEVGDVHEGKKVLKQKPNKCSNCEACFRFKKSLKKHIASVHEELKKNELFQCSYCDVSYAKEENLNAHFSTVHKKKKTQSQVKKK